MTATILAGALVVTVALGLTAAVVWGSAPRCPTDAQKKKAFADLKAGTLTPEQWRLVAEGWAKAGCTAEAEALRVVANTVAAGTTAAIPGASKPGTATSAASSTSIAGHGRRPPPWMAMRRVA